MPRHPVDASVILATYNQLPATRLALQALFAQKTSYRFEVIVCDDGSDADTVAAFRDTLQSAPVPAYLTWQQDKGFRAAASRNNGIRLSRGRILIFLDGDLVPEEDFVERHLQAHEQDCVVAVGNRQFRDPEAVRKRSFDNGSLWTFLRSNEALDERSQLGQGLEKLFRQYASTKEPWTTCYSSNISVAKSPIVEFDEAFEGWGSEDWDLFYGLTKVHGHEVRLVDAVAYDVLGWKDQRLWPQSSFVAHLRNGMRFLDKWQHTGLKAEFALPRYDFAPGTQQWSVPKAFRFGVAWDDWPDYTQMVRRWLAENAFYPSEGESAEFNPTAESDRPSPSQRRPIPG
jgi:glycosyltransferase involved in cell wall biosynthesis